MHNAAPSKSRDGQGLSPWAAPLAAVAAILWGWIAIAKSLPESLWLDELHSVWCATGTSGEVAHRAALGNQLSTYFWLLRWMGQTFGTADGSGDITAEAVWRAPSVGAWLGVVILCGWVLGRQASRSGRPLALAGLALIVLDRLQIFYATEVRPYALVALVNLAAWLAMAAWSSRWFTPGGARSDVVMRSPVGVAEWLAWCALNTLACWLQPTAALSVAAQYVFLCGAWLCRRGRVALGELRPVTLWPIGLGGLVFALSMLPSLQVLWPVWEHRQRWAAFAAGTGLDDVLLLLPFTALAGPLAIGALLHWLLGLSLIRNKLAKNGSVRGAVAWFTRDANAGGHGEELQVHQEHAAALRSEWWMWLAAWSLPCLLVYLLTASGIAPLMHRRYVFVAAAPFVLWAAGTLARLRGRGLRWVVLLAMAAILVTEQGSLSEWLSRKWPAAVRGEDWRGAVEWINSQTSPDAPVVVFCASNLIEGAGVIPANEPMREYLTLPLRSIYRIEAASRIVPLANDPSTWAGTIAAETRPETAPEKAPLGQPVWLVVRASAAGWERRLHASGIAVGEHRDFGGVQVARDVGFKKMP